MVPVCSQVKPMSVDVSKLPFSSSRVALGIPIYLSGQIGLGEDGKLVNGFEAQVRQTIENIRGVLGKSRMTLHDVVDVYAVLAVDMSNYDLFNHVYAEEFAANDVQTLPSRTCVSAPALPRGALVELKVVASLLS